MEQEASLRILSRLVRIGTVMSVDKEKRMVRVKFQNEGMPSGWLYVLQHYKADLYIEPDAEHTHSIHDTYTGGGSAETFPNHDHLLGSHVTWWLPKIDDAVLCLCLPADDGDGYVLGAI